MKKEGTSKSRSRSLSSLCFHPDKLKFNNETKSLTNLFYENAGGKVPRLLGNVHYLHYNNFIWELFPRGFLSELCCLATHCLNLDTYETISRIWLCFSLFMYTFWSFVIWEKFLNCGYDFCLYVIIRWCYLARLEGCLRPWARTVF